MFSKLWRKRTVNSGSFEKLFGFENEISCPVIREFWWYREIMPFVQLWMEGFLVCTFKRCERVKNYYLGVE